ncbi:hypothetical protein [Nesterenkonia xinjiangensis]|uniref:Uncharacterized protein n=1 Tax=Nesterenkonia xinjiangensis TaxID=225327 RepID=A0A7Z0KAJ1_9MICC|nr:hypothetical protein [Nesterenkonia xinjiangensis]NYJ78350.1 hypothetical protein [Nesterenkonia xinjiangensis]
MAGDQGTPGRAAADDGSEGALHLVVHVRAAVILTDQQGERSRHPDMAAALDAVRRSHQGHLSPMLSVQVDPSVRDIVDEGCWTLDYIEPERCEGRPRQAMDFQITYDSWSIQAPGATPRDIPVERLRDEIATIIVSSGKPVEVLGDLLGMTPVMFGLDPSGHVVAMPEELAVRIRTAEPVEPEPAPMPAGDSGETPEGSAVPEGLSAAEVEGEGGEATSSEVRTRSERRAREEQQAKRRRRRRVAAAVVLTGVVAVAGWFFLMRPDDGQADSVATPWPELVDTDADLQAEHPMRLWSLDPSEADQLSVFSAGVLSFDSDEQTLLLRNALTGEIDVEYALDSELLWTTELRIDGDAAVGVRTQEEFVILAIDGIQQRWPIPEGAEVTVMGELPLLHDGDEVHVLVADSEDPVRQEVNPELITGAADGEGVIQARPGEPEIVFIPFDEDESSQRTELAAPAEEADFSKHLAVGHGHALSHWMIEEDSYYVVHTVSAGEVTAVLETRTQPAESPAWEIGRGMDLAIIENYAVSLTTGELVAAWENGEFAAALGPAAIMETDGHRQIVLDQHVYSESDRVIGVSPRGTLWVRQPDGSVVALSRDRGDA